MKVIGILLFLFGGFVFLVGAGGAAANFFFQPKVAACDTAQKYSLEAMALAKEYENAKGTSEEIAKQVELKMKMDEVEAWSDSCARQKDSFRFYGMVFSGVAFVA